MNHRKAKLLLLLAQLMPFATMCEYLLLKSLWTAPFTFVMIWILGAQKCANCNLPVWDKRVMGTRLPVSLHAFDRCPQCAQPMFHR